MAHPLRMLMTLQPSSHTVRTQVPFVRVSIWTSTPCRMWGLVHPLHTVETCTANGTSLDNSESPVQQYAFIHWGKKGMVKVITLLLFWRIICWIVYPPVCAIYLVRGSTGGRRLYRCYLVSFGIDSCLISCLIFQTLFNRYRERLLRSCYFPVLLRTW